MPGIVGLITSLPREWAQPQVERMVEVIRHESFYEIGTWEAEPLGVYAGWSVRRDASCHLPLVNEREDVVLLFAGEEFPEPGIARQLRQQGHDVEAQGPSYLVHVAEEDSSFPRSLNGRFHGLVVDRRRQTVMLFNDRWGMHRIYYHESKDGFYFASEAKAILAVRPELRKVDVQSLGEFVACGCVLEHRTLFDRIHVLPPASSWRFRNGRLERKDSYFQPREWEDQAPLEPEAYYRELREVFKANLPRYFNGPDRIGISLTGGLDSRMILAWQKSAAGALRCYSFGSMYRDCQDVVTARRVAQTLGQPHEIITLGSEFLSRFPHYAERTVYLTDGCNDVNRAADLYVNERARGIAPIRMTGNYGGEVLRQIRAFKPSPPLSGLFQPELLSHVREASTTYSRIVDCHPVSFAVFRQAPWHHYGLLALEETQLSLRTPYLDNDLVRTAFRAPKSARTNEDVCRRLIADGDTALDVRKLRTDRGVGGNGMGISAAISRRLLEFTFKAEYAYDYGMPQSVARIDHLLSPLHLERLFLGRHKFAHYRVWYRDALSGYVREMLLDRLTLSRPYVEPHAVERIVGGHLKGDRNYTTAIHKLLTLELVHRLFLDS